MADDLVDATGALDFVLLRAPEPVGDDTLRVHYISDGELLTEPGVMTHVPPPPTVADYSWVGRLVFEHVYAQSPPADPLTDLRDALLDVIGPSVFQPGSTGPQQR